jgi:hypothetical protein
MTWMRDSWNTDFGNSESKKQSGRPKRSRENNIKLNLTGRGYEDSSIVYVDQESVQEQGNEHQNSIKLRKCLQ